MTLRLGYRYIPEYDQETNQGMAYECCTTEGHGMAYNPDCSTRCCCRYRTYVPNEDFGS